MHIVGAVASVPRRVLVQFGGELLRAASYVPPPS